MKEDIMARKEGKKQINPTILTISNKNPKEIKVKEVYDEKYNAWRVEVKLKALKGKVGE